MQSLYKLWGTITILAFSILEIKDSIYNNDTIDV